MSLSPSQERAVSLIEDGQDVFITGPAGTGKSFLIQHIIENFPAEVTATTGVAARNVSGMTIHAWAGIGIYSGGDSQMYLNRVMGNQEARSRITFCETLIVDEVSMLSGEMLDVLNIVFQLIRDNEMPFGGIQMIFVGDFCQLPMIEKREGYAFESRAWGESSPEYVQLHEVFRQDDPEFVRILHSMREGHIDKPAIRMLKAREGAELEGTPIELVSTNAEAKRINEQELSKIKEEPAVFESCFESGEGDYLTELKRTCPVQDRMVYKKGSRVMLLVNNRSFGLVNGDIGTVIDYTADEEGEPAVKVDFDGRVFIIGYHKFELHAKGKAVASMEQIPLRLAWAITIHKSQGLSLTNVRMHLGKCFAPGQVYVAISRARSLDTMSLVGFNYRKIKASKKVLKFYQEAA